MTLVAHGSVALGIAGTASRCGTLPRLHSTASSGTRSTAAQNACWYVNHLYTVLAILTRLPLGFNEGSSHSYAAATQFLRRSCLRTRFNSVPPSPFFFSTSVFPASTLACPTKKIGQSFARLHDPVPTACKRTRLCTDSWAQSADTTRFGVVALVYWRGDAQARGKPEDKPAVEIVTCYDHERTDNRLGWAYDSITKRMSLQTDSNACV
jgi:hypothetical protein